MNEELLYPAEPTYNNVMSKIAIAELTGKKDWVKFTDLTNKARFDYWLQRYLTLHAKIPSVFSPVPEPLLVPAIAPLATFRVISDAGIIYDGGGFSNGAVLRIRARNFQTKILMVDKEIVDLFKYDLEPLSSQDVDHGIIPSAWKPKGKDDNGRTEDS